MPIATSCSCGRALRLKDELAGKRVRCPSCQAVPQVPDGEVASDFEIVEKKPEPADDYPAAIRQSHELMPRRAVPDEAPPPPPKRRKRRRRVDDGGSRRGFPISFSPGLIGGFLCMVIAVVWFIVGWFAGWIFFYPPILFVIGLVRFVASLIGREED